MLDSRWNTFDNFLADMGIRPDGMTLERIDNNMGYCPENCRWATRRDQANNRETNVMFEYRGERRTLADLARTAGLSKHTLRHRLLIADPPWEIEAAMNTPSMKGRLPRGDHGEFIRSVDP